MVMQTRRTATPNNPPTGLAQGQLAVGMADTPPSLWVGVPTTLDPSGRKLISPVTPQLKVTRRVFNASGTYTPPAGLQYALVECIGGGGGGGSAYGAGTLGGGGGGGSGGYSSDILAAAQIGASQTVTIGTAGDSTSSGGMTSFGSLVTAPGGGLGQIFDGASHWGLGGSAAPGAGEPGGGTTTTPSAIVLAGTQGYAGYVSPFQGTGGPISVGVGGAGAPAMYLGRPGGQVYAFAGQSPSGLTGSFGCGGGGAAVNNPGQVAVGGAGGAGVCLVTEYSF
jgi:hypothetical protein